MGTLQCNRVNIYKSIVTPIDEEDHDGIPRSCIYNNIILNLVLYTAI